MIREVLTGWAVLSLVLAAVLLALVVGQQVVGAVRRRVAGRGAASYEPVWDEPSPLPELASAS